MLSNAIALLTPAHFIVLGLAYLLGSIPFGLILTSASGIGDIRKLGSGNVGATNVLRTGNKGIALFTLLFDLGKGSVAVLLAYHSYPGIENNIELSIFAGLAVVIGHNFPIWINFKGGKGVATTLGTLLAIAWPVGIATCVTWCVVAITFRYSSLAAIVSLVASPFYAMYLDREEIFILATLLAMLAMVRHHRNIRNLITGNESKIGTKT